MHVFKRAMPMTKVIVPSRKKEHRHSTMAGCDENLCEIVIVAKRTSRNGMSLREQIRIEYMQPGKPQQRLTSSDSSALHVTNGCPSNTGRNTGKSWRRRSSLPRRGCGTTISGARTRPRVIHTKTAVCYGRATLLLNALGSPRESYSPRNDFLPKINKIKHL